MVQLLTVKQVAGQLGVSRSTVYKMLDDGVFPAAPIRFPRGDPHWPQEVVDEWVDTGKCDGDRSPPSRLPVRRARQRLRARTWIVTAAESEVETWARNPGH